MKQNTDICICELSLAEMQGIDGGTLIPTKVIWKIINYIGVADMIEEARDGWNEAGSSREYSWT